MKLTRSAIGLLNNQYKSILKKCFLINVGLFALVMPNNAKAVDITVGYLNGLTPNVN